jgi:hypothetical protein
MQLKLHLALPENIVHSNYTILARLFQRISGFVTKCYLTILEGYSREDRLLLSKFINSFLTSKKTHLQYKNHLLILFKEYIYPENHTEPMHSVGKIQSQ